MLLTREGRQKIIEELTGHHKTLAEADHLCGAFDERFLLGLGISPERLSAEVERILRNRRGLRREEFRSELEGILNKRHRYTDEELRAEFERIDEEYGIDSEGAIEQ